MVTGLRRERFLGNFTTPITGEDVAQAPPEHRARLQAAADSGELLCGFSNHASLTATSRGENVAPAAPFVGALTGARAGAITVAVLMGDDVPGNAMAVQLPEQPGKGCLHAVPRHMRVSGKASVLTLR